MALTFKPVLCTAIIEGRKTMTRRPLKPDGTNPYAVGQRHAVLPGMARPGIATIEITSAHIERLGAITDDAARREGFVPTSPDWHQPRSMFLNYWLELYGRIDLMAEVIVIEFVLLTYTATICECCEGSGVKELGGEGWTF